MWLHRFDVISQSIISVHNNTLYKYYRICSGIYMHASFVMLWLQVVQPLANVHETRWTPHVKRESDVVQSYTSSGSIKYTCLRVRVWVMVTVICLRVSVCTIILLWSGYVLG